MSGDKLVLIAEDERLIGELLRAALVDAGYSVEVAHNGPSAMAVLSARGPSVQALVTDVHLGCGMSGWELADRAREALPHLPVVYTSGAVSEAWSARAVLGGAMLPKPFRPDDLLVVLRGLAPQLSV